MSRPNTLSVDKGTFALSPNSGETSLGTNYSTPSDTRLPVNDDETNLSLTAHVLHTFFLGDPEKYETETDSTGTSIILHFFLYNHNIFNIAAVASQLARWTVKQ